MAKIWTREEIYESLEYRVLKTALIKEFPFIADLVLTDDNLRDNKEFAMLFFLTIIIDVDKFCEINDAELRFQRYTFRPTEKYFLSTVFRPKGSNKITDNDMEMISKQIEEFVKEIVRKMIFYIPKDKRLKWDKAFAVHAFSFMLQL